MDDRAVWRGISTPVSVDYAANNTARYSRIRDQLLAEPLYLGNPELQLPQSACWVPHRGANILVLESSQPLVLSAVVSIPTDTFHLAISSDGTVPMSTSIFSAFSRRPTHPIFHEDYQTALAHISSMTSSSVSAGFPFHYTAPPLYSLFPPDTDLLPHIIPAYDMHDRLIPCKQLRRNLSGADVLLHFHLLSGDTVVASLVNVTVIIPPCTTWCVTPRIPGVVASNPYPIQSFRKI
ncbi:hypothetical protein H0H93_006179 [Arthromyces matolae]|nr:hypothetical protein H0H93_006179 [Arthromyces matolae]